MPCPPWAAIRRTAETQVIAVCYDEPVNRAGAACGSGLACPALRLFAGAIIGDDGIRRARAASSPQATVRLNKLSWEEIDDDETCLDLHRVRAGAWRIGLAGVQPADAQQRKSLRWTTSQVGSYGYTVAASMAKIVEQALGGEYTVTVQPYATPTVAMKAVMDGNGEIAYTADIGIADFLARSGGFKDYKPSKPEIVHTWYAYPMESLMATTAKNAPEHEVLEGLQRQAGVLHAGRLHELAELPAHLQGAQLRLQARPDRRQGERRRAGGRHGRRLGRLHHVGLAALVLLEGDRNPHRTCGWSILATTRSPSSSRPASRWSTSMPKGAFAKDVGPKTLKGVPILFAYNARADMPEDMVYKMVKAFYDKKDELVKIDAGFSDDGQGLRRLAGAGHQRQSGHGRCIRASPSSSRSTRPGTTSGRFPAARADRLKRDHGAGTLRWRRFPPRCISSVGG